MTNSSHHPTFWAKIILLLLWKLLVLTVSSSNCKTVRRVSFLPTSVASSQNFLEWLLKLPYFSKWERKTQMKSLKGFGIASPIISKRFWHYTIFTIITWVASSCLALMAIKSHSVNLTLFHMKQLNTTWLKNLP